MAVPCISLPLPALSTHTGDTLLTQQVLKTRFTHSIGLSYPELCPLLEKGQLVCEGAPYSEKPLLPSWELVRPQEALRSRGVALARRAQASRSEPRGVA